MTSFDLKLGWAQDHLDWLNSEVSSWCSTESERITDEPDPKPSHQQLAYANARHRRCIIDADFGGVSDDFALATGDCVHCLRASLDHLAMALAESFTTCRLRRSMTAKEIEKSEFPIFWKGAMTPDQISSKIGCIDPAAQAVIQKLQPHHRGARYATHPLWRIHELDRIDKHRRLVLHDAWNTGQGKTGSIGFVFEPGDEALIQLLQRSALVFAQYPPALQVKPGTVLCQYSVVVPDNAEVKMKPRIPLQVVFGKGEVLELQPLIPTLQSLIDFVRNDVFPKLVRFL